MLAIFVDTRVKILLEGPYRIVFRKEYVIYRRQCFQLSLEKDVSLPGSLSNCHLGEVMRQL